nr:GNAT family N-acetyltransferase [uncultured Anaeromusa sp.]
MEDYNIRQATVADLPILEELLQKSDLPIIGISLESAEFLVAETKTNEIIGVLGAQYHAASTLLRSFAVTQDWRRKGVGLALVKAMFDHLHEQKRKTLYLLTETATAYFECLGFQAISREEIPQPLLVQSGLDQACPCSSQCMKKIL